MENEARIRTRSSSLLFKFKVVVVVVLNLFVFMGIFMALLSLKKTRLAKYNRNYCIKEDCVRLAMKMQTNLDRSVNPCKHFFNFTCGNYKSENIGQPNFFEEVKRILFQKYMDIFSNYTLKFMRPAENLRTFHNMCVSLEADNKNYKVYVRTILKNFNWPPLTKRWNKYISHKFNWLDLEGKLIKKGLINSLIQFKSGTNETDKREVLQLNCVPSLITGSWSNIVTEKTTINSFKQIVRNFIKIVNGEENLADEIVQMFIKIEDIKSGTELQNSVFKDTSNLMFIPTEVTLGELDNRWKINLSKFCGSLFSSFMNITKNTSIILMSDCPSRLINFLKETPKRSVAGYMLWEAARDLLWIINKETRNLHRQLNLLLQDKGKQSMELICHNFNSHYLPELWSYIYVKAYYFEAKKNRIVKILNLILDEAKALIKNSWLSDSTKKIFHNKFSKIKYVIDHDEEFLSDEYIQSIFADLNFDNSNMINSVLNIQAHSFKRYWKIFSLNYKKRPIFTMHAITANAYYYVLTNSLFIPAAITTGMLYSDDSEGYLNFGGIGTIISHELFHSVDLLSIEIDDEHNHGSWLNDKEISLLEIRFNCFIQQYSKYNLTSKLQVNGVVTLNENIADSGIILAYRAYLKWLKTNKVKKLPGFGEYNERQLFWIMFGNVWCEKYTEEYLEFVHYANDPHTIGKFRVLGVLSNSQEFSTDFDCPIDSYMNPKNKCKYLH